MKETLEEAAVNQVLLDAVKENKNNVVDSLLNT
jgi:hypothetical protein